MTIITERDQTVTKVVDEATGRYTVTCVDNQRSGEAGGEIGGKQSESYSGVGEHDDITMTIHSQKKDNILVATLASIAAYVILNLLLFIFAFFWPGTFQSTVFKGWPHLSENSAFLYSCSSVWFVMIFVAASLVVVGFHQKNSSFLIPHLVLASAQFVQITLYSGTLFAFALVDGVYKENNYFGMESTVAYIFSILGIGILMVAFCIAYFFSFVGLVLESKKIIESRAEHKRFCRA